MWTLPRDVEDIKQNHWFCALASGFWLCTRASRQTSPIACEAFNSVRVVSRDKSALKLAGVFKTAWTAKAH
jgi:hypothetical protein